jgi:hypothetical protein
MHVEGKLDISANIFMLITFVHLQLTILWCNVLLLLQTKIQTKF